MKQTWLFLLLVCLAFGAAARLGAEEPDKGISIGDCPFVQNPEEFRNGGSAIRNNIFNRTQQFNKFGAGDWTPVDPSTIERRNFIDDEIFGKMASQNALSARISSDEEFFRRINLDLTGRLPSPDAIRNFLADPDRSRVINELLNSEGFNDKWTIWLGDLLKNNKQDANVNRRPQGRNTFHEYILDAITTNKSLKDIAIDTVTAEGHNFDYGPAGFPVGAWLPMNPPAQDRWDNMLVQTAKAWLGQGYYDCLLCHNGNGHLDLLSLWGKNTRRSDAWKMSSFFSKMRWTAERQSYRVEDNLAGGYDVRNVNEFNRPARRCTTPECDGGIVHPKYQFTNAEPSDDNWRGSFAENMAADPMFARNLANRLWKQMFNKGLVEPVEALDPARLDPDNPPQDGEWDLQATHPRLLQSLADELVAQNFNLRGFIRLFAESSAYQLSSRYDGEWQFRQVDLFARHFARRLEGEEIFDAISQATGVFVDLPVQNWDTVQWAGKLPDFSEPSNANYRNFMNAFFRGNRDDEPRRQSSSILQQLKMMNDVNTLLNRVRITSQNIQDAAGLPNGDAVDQLFLLFVSRFPSAAERSEAVTYLDDAGSGTPRNRAIEDLAWALVAKLDFEFSY